jgi:hypothetical protein
MSVYKGALEALFRAYDQTAIDRLLLFTKIAGNTVGVSGDGVLQYGDLIASNLVTARLASQNGPLVLYVLSLTDKGVRLINAWQQADREAIAAAMEEAPT